MSFVSRVFNRQLSHQSTLHVLEDHLIFGLDVNEVGAHVEGRAEKVRVCFEVFVTAGVVIGVRS